MNCKIVRSRFPVYCAMLLLFVMLLLVAALCIRWEYTIMFAPSWLFAPAHSISRMTFTLICLVPLLCLLVSCYLFRRLTDKIKRLASSTETYGKVLDQNRDMIKNRILVDLLRNNRWDDSPILSLRIAPQGGYYQVCSVMMDDGQGLGEQDREPLLHAAVNIAEEMLERAGFLLETALPDGQGMAIILFNSAPYAMEEAKLREALTELIGKLRDHLKTSWTAGIGNGYDRDTMVSASYRESTIAANHRVYRGKERIICYNELSAAPHAAKSSLVGTVVEYLETRYMDEHIGLESTADRFCINPSYMGQLMKKELGKTFLQYLSEIRIGHAKERLIRTNKTMQEIAAEVGYSNRSTFIRVFKNVVGITPSDYRNRVIRDEMRMDAAEGR